MDPRIQNVLMQMERNFHRKLPLNKIAQSVNLSSWHLHHLFKAETGMSPSKYQKQLRMQKARHLLETTFLTIKEIMLQTGLRDESHFIRDFKRAYSMTPVRYRRHFLAGLSGGRSIKQSSKIG